MTKRIRIILITMLSAVVVLLGLQAYLSVSDYQRKKVAFEQEVDSVLYRALDREFQARLDTLTHSFIEDLNDPDIVRIKLGETTEGNLAFHFLDPEADNIYTSISFRDMPGTNSPTMTDSLWQFFAEKMAQNERENLAANTTMFWTDTLGKRTQLRRNTMPIDTLLLLNLVEQELLARGIRSAHHIQLIESPATDSTLLKEVYSVAELPYPMQYGPVYASLTLTNPTRDILRRTLWTIGGSLAVILLTVASFYLLFATILRQKKLADLKDDFIDNVTHELQTPIAALRMATESLKNLDDGAEPERRHRYLAIAQTELSRLSALVDRILERSWTDHQKEPLHLAPIIADHVSGLRQKANKPVMIREQLDHSVYIQGEQHQVDVILNNLLQNALKYSDDSGVEIEVHLRQDTSGVELSIADDGWGIVPEDIPYIFDKFTRSSHTDRNYSVKGLGIGLYHVRQCVEAMGGHITVAPNTPKGTVFTIQFPPHDEDPTG